MVDDLCPLCPAAPETLEHLFLRCPIPSRYWYSSPWKFRTCEFSGASVKQWWEYILAQVNEAGVDDVIEQVACCMWSWWKHKCKLVFGETSQALDVIISSGLQLAMEYIEANHQHAGEPRALREGETIANNVGNWTPPSRGYYKLNCDASFAQTLRKGAVGTVFWNAEGEFVGAFFRTLPFVATPLIAKALALREGLEFANRQGWHHMEVESDSQILIKSVLEEFSVPLEIDLIVEDIRYQGEVLNTKFQYVRRVSNNMTHIIAHWNYGSASEASWLHYPPHWLLTVLRADCNS